MAFIDLPEHTEQWHAHRLKYIGGSEIAALFGEEERNDEDDALEDVKAGFSDSLFSLHYIKSGAVKPNKVDSDLVDAGTFMEPGIAAFAAHKRGWTIVKGRYAIDDTTPGMGASLDYEIVSAGKDEKGVETSGSVIRGIKGPLVGPGVFQIKNVRSQQFAKKWTNGEPPPYVILQVMHEIACSGFQWGVVGAWVGGNSLKLYFYERREQVIAEIRRKVTEFWQRIKDGTPPAADGSDASSYVLRQLYPVLTNNETAPIDLSGNNEVPGLCAALERTSSERLALEKEEKSIKNRLSKILDGSTYAKCGDWRIKIGVTPENPGRPAKPNEIIGARKEVRKVSVKEVA